MPGSLSEADDSRHIYTTHCNRTQQARNRQKNVCLLHTLSTSTETLIYLYQLPTRVMSNNKRFKREPTLLEQLPNELFIEIVSYLNGVDALYAFSQLNTRFQHVTFNYCSIFDFKSVSKAKFDFVIRQEDKQQWRWLRLSDDFDTPGQITLFFRQVSLANDLSQLRSLTLVNSSQEDKTVLLSQINSLVNLESLSIDSICGKDMSPIDLPLLKRLIVSSCCHTDWMKVNRPV